MSLAPSELHQNVDIVSDKATLRKTEIIRGHKSIENLLQTGKKYLGKAISIFYLPGTHIKVGFIVSRKYKRSVDRNRLRRLMKEVYRRNKREFPFGNCLLFCKYRENLLTYHELKQDIFDTLQKIKGK